MTGTNLLYIIMAIPAFVFAALTVLVRNIVHAVICLIMCLLSLVPIYIALRADFIAAAQVAIYVGAISIMIIFAVMFIHDKAGKMISHLNRWTFVGVITAMLLFCSFFYILTINNSKTTSPIDFKDVANSAMYPGQKLTSVQAISETMFYNKSDPKLISDYFIPVQLASFVILGALVGAIEMAKKKEDEL